MNHTDKCIDLLSGRKNDGKPLAQIAEMESKPLTWNERINQMTAEEKAEWIKEYLFDAACEGVCMHNGCNGACTENITAFFNSPYTEGETE